MIINLHKIQERVYSSFSQDLIYFPNEF